MAVNPLDVYRVITHPTMGPDDKSKAIDMLYGIEQPTTAAPVDLRTASTDPSQSLMAGSGALNNPTDPSLTPPAPAPSASDAGMSLPPDANASPIPPVSLPQDSTPKPADTAATPVPKETPGGEEVAGGKPIEQEQAGPTPTLEEMNDQAYGQLAREQGRGTYVAPVKEHDRLLQTQTTQGPRVPYEMKQRIAETAKAQADTAFKAGEEEAQRHEAAAKQAEMEAGETRKERATYAARYKVAQEHVQRMDKDYEKLVKDTAIQPGSYWSSKDTAHKVLSFIGAIMFGLASDPKGMEHVIDRDYQQRNMNRDKQLSAAHQSIEDVKGQMVSPEAAEQMDRALGMQAAAAETRRMAEAAAAPEARTRGLALAQQFDAQAAMHAAEMARQEGETVHKVSQHVEARAGGVVRKSFAEHYAYAVKMHIPNPAIYAQTATYGTPYTSKTPETPEQAEKNAKRMVILPDGTPGYVGNDSEMPHVQQGLDELSGMKHDNDVIRGLVDQWGHTLPGSSDRARLKVRIESAEAHRRAAAKAKGIRGPAAAGDSEDGGRPFVAEALDKIGGTENFKAGLDEMDNVIDGEIQSYKRRLAPSPYSQPIHGKMPSLGASAEKTGFKAD